MDPPWPEKGGGKIKRGADRHYPVMSTLQIIQTILACPMWHPAADAHCWCWVTDNYLRAGLTILDVIGFRYVRTMVWNKPRIGLGQYLRGKHEICLFAVRGRLPAQRRDQQSSFDAPLGRHSEKPARAYEIIEAVGPGPRLEMFARQPREGWDVWGNEVT